MTHLFDSSAALAHYFDEPGADRVEALLRSPEAQVGLCILSLFEIVQAVVHRTSDEQEAEAASELYASLAAEIDPVSREVVETALRLRRAATARIALADVLIAATAARAGAVLVHRDPHFAALVPSDPAQEALSDKA